MDSVILNQLNNLEKGADSEVKVIRKKAGTKTFPTINEGDTNDIREKRERLIACSKQYLGKNTLNSKLMRWIAITLIHC